MMAKKRFAVTVAAVAAMTATTAVPALAQSSAAEPVEATAAGGQYAEAEDCVLTTYPEQQCLPQVEGSGQYAPGTPASSSGGGSAEAEQEEAFAGVGVVENLGDGYGLRLGALEGVRLEGDFDFAAFEGEEVRVSGRFAIDESRARVLLVESIEPVATGGEEPRKVTWTFELSTECEPPAGSAFFGRTIAPEGTMAGTMDVALSDPDGDGVYSGSDFGYVIAGSTEPNIDTAPPTLQVVRGAVAQGPAGNSFPAPDGPVEVIEDFGVVKLDEDKTFSASASYCDGGTDDGSGSGNGGSGGTDNGNGGSVVSGDTSNANKKGGSGSVDASGSASQGSSSPVAKVLPATGGILPVAAAVGALLIAGGLVARRIFS